MSGTKYEGEGVDQLAEVVRLLQTQPASRRILMSAWNVADLGKMALPPCHLLAQFYVSYPGRESGPATSTSTSTTSTTTSTDSTASAVIGDEQQQQQPAQGVLHATLYQRSADSGLGLPFNIASYALLTHMLAHVCHLRPGTLTVMLGDAHVYLDHVETLKQQLLRAPKEFPELRIGRAAPEREGEGVVGVESMEGWTVGDFEVCGYDPHGRLDMKMSV